MPIFSRGDCPLMGRLIHETIEAPASGQSEENVACLNSMCRLVRSGLDPVTCRLRTLSGVVS